MTKAQIVEEIVQKTGLTKKDVAETVDQFLKSISDALADGKHLEIRGFGTFKVKLRKARMARNPRTGDPVPVPERLVPVFKVSKELKDMVATTNPIAGEDADLVLEDPPDELPPGSIF
ncbi:MAG: HU family DNA-binding protein [Candidatus Krumholzibacteria bacterium]|jgi:nucleoid DNA-binding protein|nr:HU family DNA-binding protein [Candidatus Krumholzibacteria bacterium]MDP6668758.1 HU family DNA-binding protein [Candidatus Krumholzibacteria bacterium]MDP6797509.1 HU family DNA-binding protein [Candidatus Krumholzibacteria bacterium]MDP7021504.1 HU family DNA-binding protein [Candidatus Krumholzibacteria bacterium]